MNNNKKDVENKIYKTLIDINKKIEQDTGNANLFFNRARIYMVMGKLGKALEDFNKAIDLEPDKVDYFSLRAIIYKCMGKHGKALEDMNKTIDLDSDNPILFGNRAMIYKDMGKNGKALEDINKAIEQDPGNANLFCCYRAIIYQDMGKSDNLLENINKAIKLEPNKIFPYLIKCGFFIRKKDLRNAKKTINKIYKKLSSQKFKQNSIINATNYYIFYYILKARVLFMDNKISEFKEILSSIREQFENLKNKFSENQLALFLGEDFDSINLLKSIFIKNKFGLEIFKDSVKILFEIEKDDWIDKKLNCFYKEYKESINSNKLKDKEIFLLKTKIKILNFLNEKIKIKNTYIASLLSALSSSLVKKYENKLEAKTKEAIRNKNQAEMWRKKLQKMVQQYTHSLSNTLIPNTIYEVANKLKSNTQFKKDALVLSNAYKAELFIKKQGQMLHIRNSSSSKTFQSYIREDRLELKSHEGVSILEILYNSFERVLASKLLNINYNKLNSIRETLCKKWQTDIEKLKEDFEENVFFKRNSNIINWINNNIDKVDVNISELWSILRFKVNNYAEALLQGYFTELIFNSLKYRNQENRIWLKILFKEKEVDGKQYLQVRFCNPVNHGTERSLGSGEGLNAIKNDLEMLNESEMPEKTLKKYKSDEKFCIELSFEKYLLVPTPKKEINFKNIKELEE